MRSEPGPQTKQNMKTISIETESYFPGYPHYISNQSINQASHNHRLVCRLVPVICLLIPSTCFL